MRTHALHVDGELITVRDLAARIGVTTGAIYARLQSGKTADEILATPRRVMSEDLRFQQFTDRHWSAL